MNIETCDEIMNLNENLHLSSLDLNDDDELLSLPDLAALEKSDSVIDLVSEKEGNVLS